VPLFPGDQVAITGTPDGSVLGDERLVGVTLFVIAAVVGLATLGRRRRS
jgi:hypothetical protein